MKYYFSEKKEMEKGQSLIEAVAALAVVTIVLTALTIAVLLGLRNSEFTRKETIATQYAQQGMEVLRNKRDANWDNFNFNGVIPTTSPPSAFFKCLNSANDLTIPDNCPVSGCTPDAAACVVPNVAGFIRDVRYFRNSTLAGSGCNGGTKVTVTTWWKDAKCSGGGYCRKARVTSCFSDTRAPTPA